MILKLRAAGIEVSLIPASVRYLKACGLAYLPVENETEYRRLAAAWRHADPSAMMPGFLETLEETSDALLLESPFDIGNFCSLPAEGIWPSGSPAIQWYIPRSPV